MTAWLATAAFDVMKKEFESVQEIYRFYVVNGGKMRREQKGSGFAVGVVVLFVAGLLMLVSAMLRSPVMGSIAVTAVPAPAVQPEQPTYFNTAVPLGAPGNPIPTPVSSGNNVDCSGFFESNDQRYYYDGCGVLHEWVPASTWEDYATRSTEQGEPVRPKPTAEASNNKPGTAVDARWETASFSAEFVKDCADAAVAGRRSHPDCADALRELGRVDSFLSV